MILQIISKILNGLAMGIGWIVIAMTIVWLLSEVISWIYSRYKRFKASHRKRIYCCNCYHYKNGKCCRLVNKFNVSSYDFCSKAIDKEAF